LKTDAAYWLHTTSRAFCCAGIQGTSSPELKAIEKLKLKLYSFAEIYSSSPNHS